MAPTSTVESFMLQVAYNNNLHNNPGQTTMLLQDVLYDTESTMKLKTFEAQS